MNNFCPKFGKKIFKVYWHALAYIPRIACQLDLLDGTIALRVLSPAYFTFSWNFYSYFEQTKKKMYTAKLGLHSYLLCFLHEQI